ncbi:ADP-ribosylglycohydrolase family protein [Roseovarius sp. D22-M7]|uniref:ADP-ribosylglycohydrolase family protein n=1 Tax=Roseovarius sp. D22-M7 TaxID=3127116 RepID=UPI00300FE0EB
MIGAIAGDIVGSRFEGGPAPDPGFALFDAACRFTDDTVCSIAVAEALMDGGDFAGTLKTFVRRHPSRGYGGMFRRWAMSDRRSGYGSWGNGAPMRVAAVGWLTDDEAKADKQAAAQAEVSHDHPDAVAGAQAVARAILTLRKGGDVTRLRADLERAFGYDLDPRAAFSEGGFDISTAGTVPPALAAAFEADSWESAVRRAVGLGGDTDTLACIAGAVAEARHGVPADIAECARDFLTHDLRASLARFDSHVRYS